MIRLNRSEKKVGQPDKQMEQTCTQLALNFAISWCFILDIVK